MSDRLIFITTLGDLDIYCFRLIMTIQSLLFTGKRRSALQGPLTGNLTAHKAITYSECYIVSRTAIRKLTMPQDIEGSARLCLPATARSQAHR